MRPKVYVWPIADTDAIALNQTLLAAGNLVINGALSAGSLAIENTYVVNFWSQSKVYTINSTYDLSGINFQIDGVLNGANVSQTIAGPNNGFVSTTQLYDSVTSVVTTPSVYMGTSTVTFDSISRTVSLTSAGNLSALNFTITGTYLGQVVSEARTGPNANTVYTTRVFDSVTKISVDGAVGTAVSVGTGTTGHTQYYNFDYDAKIHSSTVQIIVTGTINYSFGVTLEDITQVATPTLIDPTTGGTLTGLTANNLTSLDTLVFRYGAITINSAGADGALTFYMLEGGIR